MPTPEKLGDVINKKITYTTCVTINNIVCYIAKGWQNASFNWGK